MGPRKRKSDFEWFKDRLTYLMPPEELIDLGEGHCYNVGSWSPLKSIILSYYTSVFTTIALNNFQNMVYIDLLAGAGLAKIKTDCNEKNDSFYVLGSPLIALYFSRGPYTRMFLAEKDQKSRRALEERIKWVIDNINDNYGEHDIDYNTLIGTIYEDAIDAAYAAYNYMHSKVTNRESILHLTVVDYEGFSEVPFEVIKKLARVYGDFIINFQTHQIARILNNPESAVLDDFFGTDRWKEISSEEYEKALELYVSQLKKIDREIVKTIKVQSDRGYHYHMIIAARKTKNDSPWMAVLDNLREKIEKKRAKNVEQLIEIIKGKATTIFSFDENKEDTS